MGQSGTQCCAHGCNKRRKAKGGGNTRSASEGSEDEESHLKKQFPRTFHTIPSEPLRRAKWLTAMRRPDWEPTKYAKICSDHFCEKDINRTGQVVQLREDAVPSRFKKFPKKYTRRKKTPIIKDKAKDAKIPVDIIYMKEEHEESEKWLHIKEESLEYSAQADDVCEHKFSSLLLPHITQESGDGRTLDSISKTHVCKETNYQLRPTEQVFVEDLQDSEGQRISIYENSMTESSQEEVPGSNLHIKSEEDDYLGDNWIEIKEEPPSYDTPCNDTCDV